jgi:hypothetical protein
MNLNLQLSRRVSALLVAALLLVASVIPLLSFGTASAAELTSRSTTIDKAYYSATDVEYIFNFDIPAGGSSIIEGIIIRWCDAARQATCAQPDNSDGNTGAADQFDASAATVDAQSFSDAPGFLDNGSADENDCDEATNPLYVVCLSRTSSVAETVASKSITLSGIDHPDSDGDATNFQSLYPHMYLYSDGDFESADQVHTGITAVALNDQLTVSATVAEYLAFCVGTDDEYITNNGSETNDCTDITDTTLNLGTVTFNQICYSSDVGSNPCENSDDTKTGYALVATNAASGVVISYIAEQDSTGGAADHLGALRIPGSDCEDEPGTSLTDRCFNSAGTVGVAFTAGTENFGMTVQAVQNPTTASGQEKGTLTSNLIRDAAYDGDGIADAEGCTAADAGTDEDCWAWDETGTPDVLASSSDVVDDEMLTMVYAATASLTTPTGTYAVTSTYIATPTF